MVLLQRLIKFSSQDISNADKSGLVFNKQPNSSNVQLVPNKAWKGRKDQKTRITTFHIVNQADTDKRKLWYFEDFFTVNNYPESAPTEPLTEFPLPIQLPDSSTIIEPTIELNGSFLSSETLDNISENNISKQQFSTLLPPPVISTATAIQYITELHYFYQSLPVTYLPNPDPGIPKLVVSDKVTNKAINPLAVFSYFSPIPHNTLPMSLTFFCWAQPTTRCLSKFWIRELREYPWL
ncbi:hypothetical protein C7212DRAFT_346687 [Tuber magnatum]|uniref:Uncharacterized protein n=1 Tax=Tuber magnatum TaxID=42249 RepID=A0A317SGU4_9PEZI|nr:hypothetical protein C7212DRAFT_346687 [Tuber magnatum]